MKDTVLIPGFKKIIAEKSSNSSNTDKVHDNKDTPSFKGDSNSQGVSIFQDKTQVFEGSADRYTKKRPDSKIRDSDSKKREPSKNRKIIVVQTNDGKMLIKDTLKLLQI